MALFGREDRNIPEVDVRGDEFTVRQPQDRQTAETPEPDLLGALEKSERKGKIPQHSWGA